jgi:hypothetical protein
MDLASYGPAFKAELTGRYQKRVDEEDQIQGDLKMVSIVSLIAMTAYLMFHFMQM